MNRPPRPAGDYVPAARHGRLIASAGSTARRDGAAELLGTIGADVTDEEARRAVQIAALNATAAVSTMLRPRERIEAVLRTTVYLVCDPRFTAHSRIADEASATVRSCWPDARQGPRTTVGVATLPGGQPVEVEITAIARKKAPWRLRA